MLSLTKINSVELYSAIQKLLRKLNVIKWIRIYATVIKFMLGIWYLIFPS